MRGYLLACVATTIAVVVSGCATDVSVNSGSEWRLAYAHDADGSRLAGDKDDLIDAVRDGKPVRIFFAGSIVEHAVDAAFLTIIDDEVFAQIQPIASQRPSVEPAKIEFRRIGQEWRMLIGTNGYFTAHMSDAETANERTSNGRWYVQH